MATVRRTIGTVGRDYSTITLWEADLQDTGIYSGNDAVGECYNDSVFNEKVVIDSHIPTTITLTAADGEKHDGTTGTGVTIIRSSASDGLVVSTAGGVQKIVSFIECDSNDGGVSGGSTINAFGNITIQGCIVHNFLGTGTDGTRSGIRTYNVPNNYDLINNIVYNIGRDAGTGNSAVMGIYQGVGTLTNKTLGIYNNTIYNIYTAGSVSNGIFFQASGPQLSCKNNIAVDAITSYHTPSDTTNFSNNLSEDATAPGSNSVTNVTLSDQFVSIISGSEDLHLASTSDAIDAGVDLGTTPAGVQYDIDGRNRDAENDTWDIGADEFVTVGGGHTRMALMGVG